MLFIPQGEASRAKTGAKFQCWHGSEGRDRFVRRWQVVVRYPRIEMMDVVKADIAGQPLQRPWQTEVR